MRPPTGGVRACEVDPDHLDRRGKSRRSRRAERTERDGDASAGRVRHGFSPIAHRDKLSTGRGTPVTRPTAPRQARQMDIRLASKHSPIVFSAPPARVNRRWRSALGVGLLSVVALASDMVSPAAGAMGAQQWVWPLVPTHEVVGAFDPPDEPWLPGHRGVDLAGHPGQAVHAAGTGQVTFAGQVAGLGVIVINHGALRTTYEPVHPTVAVGVAVTAGDVVGRLAAAGHCLPATCLHWGLLRGDTYLNPLLLVGGGPVRLLPLSGLALDPGTTLTGSSRAGSTSSIQATNLRSARWADSAKPQSSAGGTGQVSRPEPTTRRALRPSASSQASAADHWLWAGGLTLSLVGAGLSLRFPVRRVLARRVR